MRTLIVALIAVTLVGCVGLDDDALPTSSVSSAITCPIAAPGIVGPSGDITQPRPTYSWAAVTGAVNYTLYVLRVSDEAILDSVQGHPNTSYLGIDLSGHIDSPLRWKVKGNCADGTAGPYSEAYFTYVGEPDPPPSTGTCYPSLRACLRECSGVCERRINCGGPSAHKCFE